MLHSCCEKRVYRSALSSPSLLPPYPTLFRHGAQLLPLQNPQRALSGEQKEERNTHTHTHPPTHPLTPLSHPSHTFSHPLTPSHTPLTPSLPSPPWTASLRCSQRRCCFENLSWQRWRTCTQSTAGTATQVRHVQMCVCERVSVYVCVRVCVCVCIYV
jgi:hypothetical protein